MESSKKSFVHIVDDYIPKQLGSKPPQVPSVSA